jgi:hypothetical protein
VELPEIVGTIQRHDQDARPEGDDVRGLAQIKAADTTDEQIADGKIKEAPCDVDRRGGPAHSGWQANRAPTGNLQVRNRRRLCTSCPGVVEAVEVLRKAVSLRHNGRFRHRGNESFHPSIRVRNPPRQPQSGTEGCKTGFRRGFSQLTFSVERGKYHPVRFPNSVTSFCPPGAGWVCIRKKPARRNNNE